MSRSGPEGAGEPEGKRFVARAAEAIRQRLSSAEEPAAAQAPEPEAPADTQGDFFADTPTPESDTPTPPPDTSETLHGGFLPPKPPEAPSGTETAFDKEVDLDGWEPTTAETDRPQGPESVEPDFPDPTPEPEPETEPAPNQEPTPDQTPPNPDTQPEPEPEQPPVDGPKPDAEPIKIVSAKISDHDIRAKAYELANARYEQEQADATGVRGFVRNLWRATIAGESIKAGYAEEIRQSMIETQNILGDPETTGEEAATRLQAIVDRVIFASEHGEDADLRRGESVERAEASEGQTAYEAGVKDLIRQYVEGDLTAESLQEARTRMLDELAEAHPDLELGETINGDNILYAAEQAVAMVDHEVALEDLLDQMEFYATEARTGVNTEGALTNLDRCIERVQKGKIGKFVNDATIATAISAAFSVGRFASSSVLGRAAATIAPGVAAAGIGGLREHYRYKRDRQQVLRQNAQGTEAAEGQTRRERLEETAYDKISASETTGSIREILESSQGALSAEQANALLNTIAEVRLRHTMSEEDGIDLIGYTSVENMETELTQLTIATAEGAAALRAWLESATPEQRTGLGISEEADYAGLLEARQIDMRIAIDRDIDEKDRIFNKQKWKAVVAAGSKSALVGLGVGMLVQEAASAAGANTHQTMLQRLFEGKQQHTNGGETARAVGSHFERVHSGHLIKLPDGVKLVHNPDKSLNLVAGGRTLSENLHIGQNGPDAHALDQLRAAGVPFESKIVHSVKPESFTINRGLHEFNVRHPEATETVHRVGWLDNNTPGVFDKNELKLEWGGGNGSGIDSQGNYVFNVSHMTPDGSYHGGMSENAQALAREGHLKVFLSPSEGTQHHPFGFNVDSNGNAHIPQDSDAGRSLFSTIGDHAAFKGRYAEVGHVESTAGHVQNVRVFSTFEGRGVDHIRETITKNVPTQHSITILHQPVVAAGVETANKADWPPVIPVYTRSEVEPAKKKEDEDNTDQDTDIDEPTPPGGPEQPPGPPDDPEQPPGPPDDPEQPPGPPDDPEQPEPPEPPEKEPEPKKVSPPKVKSQIESSYTGLEEELPGNFLDKKILTLRSARGLKSIDNILESLRIESLKARFPDVDTAAIEFAHQQAEQLAEARKAELALEKRIMKAKTTDAIDKIIEELEKQGELNKDDQGQYQPVTSLGKFALVAKVVWGKFDAAKQAAAVSVDDTDDNGTSDTGTDDDTVVVEPDSDTTTA